MKWRLIQCERGVHRGMEYNENVNVNKCCECSHNNKVINVHQMNSQVIHNPFMPNGLLNAHLKIITSKPCEVML